MKNKALLWTFIVLLVAAIFQLTVVLTNTTYPRELILNEESYDQRANDLLTIDILKSFQLTVKNAGAGAHPRLRATLDSGKKVLELLHATHLQMEQARAVSAWPDSMKAHLVVVTSQFAQLSKMYETEAGKKFSDLPLMEIPLMPEEFRGLAVAGAFGDMLSYYQLTLDEFAIGATAIKFDSWQSILKKKPSGSEWVKGMIAFNTPRAMNLDRKERVQVRISKQFISGMVETMQRSESVTVDSVVTGDIMLVKLLGEDFKITSFDEEEQGVTEQGYTQWEFDVTPLASGDHDLYLKVGVVYYVPNLGATKKYFPVYDKQIKVTVSVWQQVAGFATARWEFIVSSIVIPLALWGFSQLRQRRKARGELK